METIAAVYDDMSDARMAVRDLREAGFDESEISLVASDVEGNYAVREGEPGYDAEYADESAAEGAVAGGVLGGLTGAAVGLAALAIPGLGPIVAVGPLAAALAGAGIGAASGTVLGALVGYGFSEDTAEYYAEAVRRGSVLVTVRTAEARAHEARDILDGAGAVDMDSRSDTWRDEGWEGYEYSDYDAYEPFFRSHYNRSLANAGYAYSRYQPAYYYGYTLATDRQYTDYDNWDDLEPVAQRDWDDDSAWEEAKDAVHYAWHKTKETVEDAFDGDNGDY
jgi:hypothetical protein